MTRMRGSLGRADSAVTSDEIDARRDAYASQAWQATGTLAVSVTDSRLSWPDKQMIKMIAAKLGYGIFQSPAEELV